MIEDRTLASGQAFGRYVIEARIGLGGMGAVYRARDGQLGRVVALKIVRPGRKDSSGVDPEVRLLSEARAVAALRHPNVVAVFDAGVIDGQTFVAMEYVEGKTLRSFVGDERASLEERRRWLGEVAEALAAAHRAGIVHRDVKPENVLIASDGRARVLDFGIAKRITFDTSALTADGASPETLEGRVVGTLSYMAPEQLAGAEVSPKWDQFSWGVMAYELLTGKHPRQTVAMPGPTAHLSQTPALPNEVESRLTFHDVAVITLAMAADAERRFPSMGALVEAWRDRTPLVPPEPGTRRPSQPAPSWFRARWVPGLTAVAVLVTGLAIGLGIHRCGAAALSPPSVRAVSSASTISIVPATQTASSSASARSSAPPIASDGSTPVPTSMRLATAPVASVRASCQCHDGVTILCAPGANFRARASQCNAEDGAALAHDGTLQSYRWFGETELAGKPCRGVDSNGVERDGVFGQSAQECETHVRGTHRTPCRGIEPYTGREISGTYLCY